MVDPKLPATIRDRDISCLTTKEDKLALREHIKSTADNIKLGMMELGRLLWGVRSGKYFETWGYESFKQYTMQELDLAERQAQYIITGYRKFKIELGASDKDLKDIKLSQIKELARVATAGNYKELLDKAREMNVTETQRMVNKIVDEGKRDRGEEVARSECITFSFQPDQMDNVSLALEVAADITHSDSKSHNLDCICLEFLANSEKTKKMSLERHLANIKRTYGVTLIPVESEELARDILNSLKEKESS